MRLLRQIVGGLLLGLALAFLLHISKHVGSPDPKATSKIVIDVVFAVVLGTGALLLINGSSEPK